MNAAPDATADEPVADAYLFRSPPASGWWYQAIDMVRITRNIIDDSDRYAVELAGKGDRFIWLTILWFKQALRARRAGRQRSLVDDPGLLGSFLYLPALAGIRIPLAYRDDYRGTGRQPVNRRTGAGYRA